MNPTLTELAARWCDAAGIPPPDEVMPEPPYMEAYWHLPVGRRFEAIFHADGSMWWENPCDVTQDGKDSASLIAAIKEATA